MLLTIEMASRISVQGILVRMLPDGQAMIRVDSRIFTGRPLARPIVARAG